MYVEPDIALVRKVLWDRVDKDLAVRDTIAAELDGVTLYEHALVMPEEGGEYVEVTVSELVIRGIIQSVTLHKNIE